MWFWRGRIDFLRPRVVSIAWSVVRDAKGNVGKKMDARNLGFHAAIFFLEGYLRSRSTDLAVEEGAQTLGYSWIFP